MGRFGWLGLAATLGQRCPCLTQSRCMYKVLVQLLLYPYEETSGPLHSSCAASSTSSSSAVPNPSPDEWFSSSSVAFCLVLLPRLSSAKNFFVVVKGRTDGRTHERRLVPPSEMITFHCPQVSEQLQFIPILSPPILLA